MKGVVAELSLSIREQKDNQIAFYLKQFLDDFSRQQNQSILNLGVYSPLKDEVKVNWASLHSLNQVKLCYPSFESEGEMVFRKSSSEELEYTSCFGVPIGAPKKEAKIEVPDICIIPGLAFSKKGARLGRGKGYYDRYLERFSGVKIGIAYSEQLEEDVPCEEHDQLLDGVVTDQGFYFAGTLMNLEKGHS